MNSILSRVGFLGAGIVTALTAGELLLTPSSHDASAQAERGLAQTPAAPEAGRIEIVALIPTPKGTPAPRVLRQWSVEEVRKFQVRGRFTSQRFIFDESAKDLELAARADIDLLTVYGKDNAGQPKVARVPRFMVWRDAFKLSFDSKKGELYSRAIPTHLKLPLELFQIRQIHRIELSQHRETYPDTKLKIRTNPAASRGEKLFTQNCLACHSLAAKAIDPASLTPEALQGFAAKHGKFVGLSIDARDARGLTAYAEALASEKPKVQSPK